MQCCKKSQPNKGHQHGYSGGLRNMLLLACCLAPVGAVLLLKLSGYGGAASYLVFLMCPLMHLFMMRGMGKKHQEPISENNSVK